MNVRELIVSLGALDPTLPVVAETHTGARISTARSRLPSRIRGRSLARVAAGGTALDPEVVAQLLGASRRGTTLEASFTRRETEVLALMAEGAPTEVSPNDS